MSAGDFRLETRTDLWIEVEPLTIYAEVDSIGGLFDEPDDERGEEIDGEIAMLLSEDGLFLRLFGADGWIDAGSEVEGVLDSLSLADFADDPAWLEQIDQTFACAEIASGTAVESTRDGEPVWVIDCEIDLVLITEAAADQLAAAGLDPDDLGYESMRQRLVINRDSGAPIEIEVALTLSDAAALGLPSDDSTDPVLVRTTTQVLEWNTEIAFPQPTPLLDAQDLAEQAMAEEPSEPAPLPTADQLLARAAAWQAEVDELEISFEVEAEIDGEMRRANGLRRSSRSQSAFETAVEIDGAGPYGLLWTSDGIWSSHPDDAGEAVWRESTPAELGFGRLTVGQFLDDPDRLDLSPWRALADDAVSIARTEIGGRPTEYELGFYEFGLEPGDERFEAVAGILASAIVELVGDGEAVVAIEIFEATLTLQSSDAAGLVFASLLIEAEFEIEAGPLRLKASRANLSLDLPYAAPPLSFSTPQ